MFITLPQYLLLFLVVFLVYLTGKTIIFHKKFHINPVQFSHYKEKVQFCAWIGLMMVLVVYGVLIVLMFLGKNMGEEWVILDTAWINFLGMAFSVMGFVMMVMAHAHMGEEWRMGVDRGGKINLVQERLFSISRNPVYLAILLQTGGLFLLMKIPAALVLWLVLLLFMRVVIRTEERFLEEIFGREYGDYKKRVRRFL